MTVVTRRNCASPADSQNSPEDETGQSSSDGSDRLILTKNCSEEVDVSFWIKSFVILFISAVYACTVRNTCNYKAVTNEEKHVRFSSDNARIHLQKITSLGPRPAGSSANELLAADYLRRELQNIALSAGLLGPTVTFDEQVASYSSFQAGFHVSAYNNLRNFLLRIDSSTPHENSTKRAFLINCHYDSAVESPGASDDFVSCAIMLDIIRIFAFGPNDLTNDLIFLFNGAEESILPSSHAFITQHPWAKEIVAFLNLEGAGSGGRLTMFQSGPGSGAELLVKTYSGSFAQPYGNVFAEELFQSGLIPSDTDFRIFRDFGLIPGLDMAYTSDGYCYHTKYDTESRISEACLQSTGDDILSFLRRIAYDEDLASIEKLKVSEAPSSDIKVRNLYLSSDEI
ncbi:Endoplasmic reticulum metallopeptidase 1, partial [Fasciolopsis buskii]